MKTKKMRVLWLAPYPIDRILSREDLRDPAKKGKAHWLVNLAMSLKIQDLIELHILTYSANINRDHYFYSNGVYFYIIKYQLPFFKIGYPHYFRIDIIFNYKRLINIMQKIVDRVQPDIIHAHGTEGPFGLVTIKNKEIPSIVSIQGIIHELYIQKPNLPHALQKRIEKKSILYNQNFGCRTEWDSKFVRSINKHAKIFYLPEAIDDVFFNNTWDGLNSNRIIFVGAVIKRKGIEDLLESFSQIIKIRPDLQLDIVGNVSKPYFLRLKDYIEHHNVSLNIVFHGFKSSYAIASLLEKAILFVLPSYSDNSPNSLCEAMAVGVPVIAYGTGGIPSLIRNKIDGFLVETGNVGKLTETILKIISDKSLMQRISNASVETAFRRNYPSDICELTWKVYNEILT